MTYRELQTFLNSLPVDYLDNEVSAGAEGSAYTVVVGTYSEDWVMSEEGLQPTRYLTSAQLDEFKESAFIRKGEPFLSLEYKKADEIYKPEKTVNIFGEDHKAGELNKWLNENRDSVIARLINTLKNK